MPNSSKLRRSLLLLTLIALNHAALGADKDTCLDSLAQKVADRNQTQNAEALRLDARGGGIGAGNEARLLRGRGDSAVIVVHGFAASPFEVEALAEKLADGGATVYLPLLPGFGSSSEVANYGADSRLWKIELEESVRLMSTCFNQLSLVGFSTGGSLVSDFLLRHPRMSFDGRFEKSRVRIRSAALLSPYFASGSVLADLSNFAASALIKTIDAQKLYRFNPSADLLALIRFPDHYNRAIPLIAARQVISLGGSLRSETPPDSVSTVPVLLAYSESDETISPTVAMQFVRDHFAERQTFVFSRTLKIPHQIALPQANPHAPELLDTVKAFITPKAALENTDPGQGSNKTDNRSGT